MKTNDYILGVTREEYDRLAFQHALWRSRAIRLWRRAGLPEKSSHPLKVLDLGCGPGFTTFELAKYLGPRGKVVGIDLAEKYLAAVNARAQSTNAEKALAKIETVHGAIDSFSLPEKNFDAAFARWIFMFVSDVETAIKNTTKHLKKGGLFMLQEYVDWGAMSLYPDNPPIFRKMVDAVMRSFAAHGGNSDIAGKLPSILARNGFEIVGLKPHARVGRPHQKVWKWPDRFFQNYLPVLESEGYLAPDEIAAFRKVWENGAQDPNAFFQGPTVLDIIARKVQ